MVSNEERRDRSRGGDCSRWHAVERGVRECQRVHSPMEYHWEVRVERTPIDILSNVPRLYSLQPSSIDILLQHSIDILEHTEHTGTFIEAKTWQGVKPGFYFGVRAGKLGYHQDPLFEGTTTTTTLLLWMML